MLVVDDRLTVDANPLAIRVMTDLDAQGHRRMNIVVGPAWQTGSPF